MADFVVLALLAAIPAAVWIAKRRKGGGCCGSCEGCTKCSCHEKKKNKPQV